MQGNCFFFYHPGLNRGRFFRAIPATVERSVLGVIYSVHLLLYFLNITSALLYCSRVYVRVIRVSLQTRSRKFVRWKQQAGGGGGDGSLRR